MLTALNHEEPDRVPSDLWFTSVVEAMLSPRYGGLSGAVSRLALGHELIAIFKAQNPQLKIAYHCDF